MKFKKIIIIALIFFFMVGSYLFLKTSLSYNNGNDFLFSLPYLEYSTDKADIEKMGLVVHEKGAMEGYVITEKYIIGKDGKIYETSSGHGMNFTSQFGRIVSNNHNEILENAGSKYFLHHDVFALSNNNIMILTKESHILKGEPVLFDKIVELDKSGNKVYSFDTFYHMEELRRAGEDNKVSLNNPIYFEEDAKKIRSILNLTYIVSNDYFHANTVYEIQENKNSYDPRFKKGNILVTFLFLNLAIIFDKNDNQIVWSYGPGETLGQHAATMLDNGNILIFDNGNNVERNSSRILEINPLDNTIVWEYSDDSFFSESQGFMQRLENNNTLITESTKGRIFEITPKKKIVWEYYMPIMNEKGQREVIYRATKIPEKSLDLSRHKFNVLWEPK